VGFPLPLLTTPLLFSFVPGMALSAAARAEHGYVKDYSEDDAAMARTAQDPAGRPLVRLGALDAARSVGLGQWRQRGGGDDGGATTRTNDGSKADGVVCGNAPRCRLVAKRGCIRGFCRRCCNAAENTATGPSGGFCSIHPSRAALAATAAASAARADDDGAHHALPPPVPVGSARVPHVTACKALFIGIGADEQCAGYSRHRTALLRGGAAALEAELDMDCARLPTRNLGRDDRCVADAAREPWFPYLDEGVVRLLASLPVSDLCDLHLPPGEVRSYPFFLLGVSHLTGLPRYTGRQKNPATVGCSSGFASDGDVGETSDPVWLEGCQGDKRGKVRQQQKCKR